MRLHDADAVLLAKPDDAEAVDHGDRRRTGRRRFLASAAQHLTRREQPAGVRGAVVVKSTAELRHALTPDFAPVAANHDGGANLASRRAQLSGKVELGAVNPRPSERHELAEAHVLENEHHDFTKCPLGQFLKQAQDGSACGFAIALRKIADLVLDAHELAIERPFCEADTTTRNAEARSLSTSERAHVVRAGGRGEESLTNCLFAKEASTPLRGVDERLKGHGPAVAIERR